MLALRTSLAMLVAFSVGLATRGAHARELVPLRVVGPEDAQVLSERTVEAAIQLDRDQFRLVAYTLKDRPFLLPAELPELRPYVAGRLLQAEVALVGPPGLRITQHADAGRLCLDHDAATPGHVQGDTILLHRDTFIVDLPDLDGFDTLEVAYVREDASRIERVQLGRQSLEPALFTAAGGASRYEDLAFAREGTFTGNAANLTDSELHWPEEYGDTDRYHVYGDAAETPERISIVFIPDGYTYAEKPTLRAHADAVVAYLRSVTPYREHDRFINYVLVYAYSTGSGTDECDCAIIADTAMTTHFQNVNPTCGSPDNRCLYYGASGSCDTDRSSNIAQAELRAPARDQTLILVNTARYGGCAGSRAVFSAANGSAVEVAVHELGHSLADLDDEYGYDPGCGTGSPGPNTSMDAANGAWPEWIDDLGPPREGAKYYGQCIYRPIDNCEMRALNSAFCPVCNQQWALTYFGHRRVSPTAPIASQSPPPPVEVQRDVPTTFAVTTRLASGPGITNDIVWRLEGPGFPRPSVIASGTETLDLAFALPGSYTLTCSVTADTNFIKPVKNGPNRDIVTWTVEACCCEAAPSFAGIGSAADLDPCASTGIELLWGPATFGPTGGSYEVWRDDVIVATWDPALPFVDRPPDDALHAYRITAVSGDCALVSGESVILWAADRNDTSPLAPIGPSLRVAKTLTGVRISWTDEPGAPSCEAARSDTRGFFAPLASLGFAGTGTPGIEDPGALGLPGIRTYRVRTAACGLFSAW